MSVFIQTHSGVVQVAFLTSQALSSIHSLLCYSMLSPLELIGIAGQPSFAIFGLSCDSDKYLASSYMMAYVKVYSYTVSCGYIVAVCSFVSSECLV